MATKLQMNMFLRLKIKVNCLKAELFFLKKCKQYRVFPKFMKIKCSIKDSITNEIIVSSKIKWLYKVRQKKYSELNECESKLYDLHLNIIKNNTYENNIVNDEKHTEWIHFLHESNNKTLKAAQRKQQTLNKKFQQLKYCPQKKAEPEVKMVPNYVNNLSSTTFTESELTLLNKGLNYTIKPKKVDIDNTIVNIETAIKFKTDFIKNTVRREVTPILKHEKLQNNSVISREFKDLKSINEKPVFIMKADKGNAMVILDKTDYRARMEETISSASFTEVRRNPLPKMVRAATEAIKYIYDVFKVPRWKLSIPNPTVPKLYGLPKIHKPGNKMRPIVSNINAPTYKIAKWLVAEFDKLTPPEGFQVKNSWEFVEKVKNIALENDDIMVSFDIISLYPNVPIPTALEVIDNWLLTQDISAEKMKLYSELTKTCMEQNEFQYDNRFYKLSHGTCMGNPLSCFVSNAFVGHLETKLASSNKFPKIWHRYVDDIFTIMKRHEVQPVLNILNAQYESIKFTVEVEENQSLSFLDLRLTREDNKIEFGIFRKASTTERYITSDSYCSFSTKMAAFNSMIYRMCRLPLSTQNYMMELKYIKRIAYINGYNEDIVEAMVLKHTRKIRREQHSTMFSTEKSVKRVSFVFAAPLTNKLKPVFQKQNMEIVFGNHNKLANKLNSTKDNIPELQKSGIYKISCGDCEKFYIGQTKRNLNTRYKEHTSHIRFNRPEKSSVALHALQEDHLNINGISLLKHVQNASELDAWESLFINRNKNSICNTDIEPISSNLFKI